MLKQSYCIDSLLIPHKIYNKWALRKISSMINLRKLFLSCDKTYASFLKPVFIYRITLNGPIHNM